jgi:hypothetical protein
MANLLTGIKSLFGGADKAAEAAKAPDGNKETLESGHWPTLTSISTEAFPPSLILGSADRSSLGRLNQSQLLLASAKVGKHKVELLLNASEHAVDLSLRVPTAPNQYKEPYIILEAEAGNSREDAVREIHFHLKGRVPDADVAGADWRGFFGAASAKLDSLRKG